MEELKLEQLICFCKMHPAMQLLSYQEVQKYDIAGFSEEADVETIFL